MRFVATDDDTALKAAPILAFRVAGVAIALV